MQISLGHTARGGIAGQMLKADTEGKCISNFNRQANCLGFCFVLLFNNSHTILHLCQKCINVLILPCPYYPLMILHFHSHGAYTIISLRFYFAFPYYVWIYIFIFAIQAALFLCIFIFAILSENESVSSSVMSDSVMQPHGLQPTRPLCPWDSPGKDTGVIAILFSR